MAGDTTAITHPESSKPKPASFIGRIPGKYLRNDTVNDPKNRLIPHRSAAKTSTRRAQNVDSIDCAAKLSEGWWTRWESNPQPVD
jgi:hypothetical protein